MIPRVKRDKPAILVQNEKSWTQELLYHIELGLEISKTIKNRYNHNEIKEELKLETDNKCIYCESSIPHVDSGEIEHIKPKSKFPNLTFEWENLTFACSVCNKKKLDYYDEQCPILNPYQDDISQYLIALGSMIAVHPQDILKRGEITRRRLSLNRPELVEKRTEKLEMLENLLIRYKEENNNSLKEILKNEIIEYSGANKEYTMCKTAFLNTFGFY